MANLSSRKPNIKNIRPNSLKVTKKKQGINKQNVTLDDGKVVKLSVKEIRNLKKVA